MTEFNYRYADARIAHLFVGMEVANRHESEHLLAELRRHRIEALDLTDNEMAKLHVRHLVGGHAPAAENEILYRFEFPERPGALMQFLNSMSRGWNISLFHYRNHGADYGRVLVGMQVPPSDKGAFREFLDRFGYDYVDETANPAYRMFSAGSRSGTRAAAADWPPPGGPNAQFRPAARPAAARRLRGGKALRSPWLGGAGDRRRDAAGQGMPQSGRHSSENLAHCCKLVQFGADADSGKVYALVSSLAPWQT